MASTLEQGVWVQVHSLAVRTNLNERFGIITSSENTDETRVTVLILHDDVGSQKIVSIFPRNLRIVDQSTLSNLRIVGLSALVEPPSDDLKSEFRKRIKKGSTEIVNDILEELAAILDKRSSQKQRKAAKKIEEAI